MVERRLLSELDACKELDLCRKTLLAHVRAGEIRYVITGKRTRKYRPRDLDDFLDRQGRHGGFAPGGHAPGQGSCRGHDGRNFLRKAAFMRGA